MRLEVADIDKDDGTMSGCSLKLRKRLATKRTLHPRYKLDLLYELVPLASESLESSDFVVIITTTSICDCSSRGRNDSLSELTTDVSILQSQLLILETKHLGRDAIHSQSTKCGSTPLF
jgi:hypothetical protein